ncbi:hypothetical protein CcaverHIS002_0503330 [Cutaneotrichosporon cavernicola]|uniref:GDP/GTP exchange factor Sec2 N-terminal domain-containing protein n=1 Tax=Cutaneotrichosporon cavernicola TaxID=279322 RepID=A0AA48QX07_9TREE|nr:uncharacterized protein CcaverHIS019_0503900 [Cutaneotrichosporon cavernicola]BEI84932.1 hypothetical protein CcaverHIS002_0503330 [Cutaneotrichosporon cavernicola]BEI92762.1 hypothetical protein CcaverHIS019_0503900 [Cutaneotrichosporon cavernicola]BEJ00539.1 hypothetical protein CcaverHIS631_0503960 [Cutaneotrichosporon cavernicola]BEJ08307.1 hypothetical protein CcaverHIS641_0503920 [Cutaneotrichosporon cavernicola]
MSTSSPSVTSSPTAPVAHAASHTHTDTVSGPVLCPFCDKELPADIISRPGIPLAANGFASSAEMSTSALMSSEGDADQADTLASKAAISDDDIRRWSSIVGVTISAPPKLAPLAQPAVSELAKPVPLLPPPPPARASPKPTKSRFGFFSKSKANTDDDDSGSDGIISGYAKLGGPGSDDEGDNDYASDEEITFKPRPRDDTQSEKAASRPETPALAPPLVLKETTGVGDAELKSVLREVLSRVQALSQSHAELQTSHTTLLTSLKIARSNLIMAEANTEMLEAELRRAKATAANAARTSTPLARSSGDVTRPSIETRGSGSGKTWFGRAKPSSPTEATMRISGEGLRSSESDELKKLRDRLASQSDELEVLKKGKKDIEAELEGLSQALFEEANKMVADERKKRAELEDTLHEVKGERAALRETVKVLGGRIQTPPPIATPQEMAYESPSLDKHYAALRRSIHHVVDSPTPAMSEPGTPPDAEESGVEHNEFKSAPSSPEINIPGAFTTVAPASLETEPNPWATTPPVAG